jgi:hypothetical protein
MELIDSDHVFRVGTAAIRVKIEMAKDCLD